MLLIRKITDAHSPANRTVVAEVQAIMRAQFPGMPASEIDKLPDQFDNPWKYRFISELLVAESSTGKVHGFALLLYASDLNFAYLETISTAPGRSGGGLGSALYDAVREEAGNLAVKGLFFECLPDDPKISPDAKIRRQNAARLKFYERFGARPIAGTLYETPVKAGTTDSPYLVFDGLGHHELPPAGVLAEIVRAILERKYGELCPPDYIERVVASVQAGGAHLREKRYPLPAAKVSAAAGPQVRIPLIVNDAHAIHHIRERGYVEAPVRIGNILKELEKSNLFERKPARAFPNKWLRATHDPALIDFIRKSCEQAAPKKSVYPYVFPIRNKTRPPEDLSTLAGYWCIDTFTPLNRDAYPAARAAVDCALTAAEEVLRGAPAVYALVRPPGHHAERRSFGGFCYFCNGAVAAEFLSRHGRVAILDIDYHHGNGQQEIFYGRADVLTVSVHGHPRFAYPYFTGFADERGRGEGAGYNLNLPLEEHATPQQHREAVARGLRRIERFDPRFLVVSLGFDTAKSDPTGTWTNLSADFRELGMMIGRAGYPTVVMQEGGYRVRTLGVNARQFFTGLVEGFAQARAALRRNGKKPEPRPAGTPVYRGELKAEDVDKVRTLVAATGRFTPAEVDVAAELVEERLAKGDASGYEFILAETFGDDEGEDQLLGFCCYGRASLTETGFDLYWVVVAPDAQRKGLGRELLARTIAAVRAQGGRRLYADTSGQSSYAPTRAFYERTGFRKIAELPDFYREGDAKLVYVKDTAETSHPVSTPVASSKKQPHSPRAIGWGVRQVKVEPGIVPGCGRGLFAAANIGAGEVIDRAPTAEIDASQCSVLDDMRPVGDYYFEHPEEKSRGLMVFGLPSLVNHAEAPNAHVRFEHEKGFGWIAVLYALRAIPAGGEITYRYRCPLWFTPSD